MLPRVNAGDVRGRMGWLRKRSKGGEARDGPPDQSASVVLPTGNRDQMIVGSEHYPDALRRVRLGAVEVELRCDPGNPYDRNAVAAYVAGRQVGYLSAYQAERYQPTLRRLEAEGVPVADGVVRKGRLGKDVLTFLPHPVRLAAWAAAAPHDRAAVSMDVKRLRIKRLGDYQDVLGLLLRGEQQVTVDAVVEGFAQPSGKYAGQTSLRFLVEGVEVGLVPAQYRGEGEDLFARVERDGPQAVSIAVRRWDEGNVSASTWA